MTGEDRQRITSDDYIDLIVDYMNNPNRLLGYQDATVQIMSDAFAVIYVPAAQLQAPNLGLSYSVIPNLYGLTDEAGLEASGVSELRNIPRFNLRGEGVLIAVIDTGIDYTNPVFLRPDGTTKVAAIWDQTIETGISPFNTEFGTEYTQEQINEALASGNPTAIVPSVDTNGHGTRMAAIAAGNENENERFAGVAPDSELLIVKVREAKQVFRSFFEIPPNVVCFQENSLMWGVHYCTLKATELGRPIVMCFGCGTSQDAHDGRSPLNTQISLVGKFPNTVIVTSVGNEGSRGRHYAGVIDPSIGNDVVELNVGEDETGFSMELWGDAPGIYSIDILSPSGEYISRIPAGLRVNRVITFIFEPTVISINYQTVETQTGDQLIEFRFRNVSPGIWRFTVYGQGDLASRFNIWLPMGDFITTSTYFVQPNIYTTLLSPGTASSPIAVTAYNTVNGNLYINAGRGYTRANVIKPELAAPGVNYIAPTLNQTFETYSGTSIASAHTAGVSALVLEWGTVRGNHPGMDSVQVKNFFIRGARRRENLTYPNRDWGYGILDIYNVFNIMRGDSSVT